MVKNTLHKGLKQLIEDERGTAWLALGFFIFVIFVIGVWSFNQLTTPTQMDIKFLTFNATEISSTNTEATFEIWTDIKNAGASGTAIIRLLIYDDNMNFLTSQDKTLDLELNQRANIKFIYTHPIGKNFKYSFSVPQKVEDVRPLETIVPAIPLSRP